MLSVKVLGTGCPNCQRLEAHAREALAQLNPEGGYEVVKITDPMEIGAHVLRTPGLMIGDQVVSQGRIPPVAEIVTWLANALTAK